MISPRVALGDDGGVAGEDTIMAKPDLRPLRGAEAEGDGAIRIRSLGPRSATSNLCGPCFAALGAGSPLRRALPITSSTRST